MSRFHEFKLNELETLCGSMRHDAFHDALA